MLQFGQSKFLDDLFHQKESGAFIECGALDGERLSNSLYFEKERHWTGVLIEANTQFFKKLLQKHRRAFKVNTCLSPGSKATVLTFTSAGAYGGLVDYGLKQSIKVTNTRFESSDIKQCFPLYSILRAAGLTHIDLFSLDVEGSEFPILEGFPWYQKDVTFDVMQIEKSRIPEVIGLLNNQSYHQIDTPFGRDIIIVKN